MKKDFVIHPFLTTLFFFLLVFYQNAHQVPIIHLFLPLVVSLLSVAIIIFLANIFVKDMKKTSLMISVFVFMFFVYGYVFDAIAVSKIGNAIARHRYMIPVWITIMIAAAAWLINSRKSFNKSTLVFNLLSAVLTIAIFAGVCVKMIQLKDNRTYLPVRDKDIVSVDYRPDIYYIVLDMYAHPKTLLELYGYDNRDFFDFLKDKGFYVASKSRSNYASTKPSLTSALNMKHISYKPTDSKNEVYLAKYGAFNLIRNNEVIDFLKRRGYKIINISSGWGITDRNPYSDVEYLCGRRWSIFERIYLLQHTMLKHWVEATEYSRRSLVRGRIFCQLSELASMPKIKGPKFVLAHFVSPHGPYVFDREGKPNKKSQYDADDTCAAERKYYLDQLIFITDKIMTAVEKILSESKEKPIIVLASDHGPESIINCPGSGGWEDPPDEAIRERMRNIAAFYLPKGGDSVIYESITPVNFFRLIFNFYFGTDYKRLKDNSYFPDESKDGKLRNVTDIVEYD